jgi:hypothetical protein
MTKAECGGEATFLRTAPRYGEQAVLDKQWCDLSPSGGISGQGNSQVRAYLRTKP